VRAGWLDIFSSTDTATTEIYPLSLHDALPISRDEPRQRRQLRQRKEPKIDVRRTFAHDRDRAAHHAGRSQDQVVGGQQEPDQQRDRKSTRLNSSHLVISYAVFCLKKKSIDLDD